MELNSFVFGNETFVHIDKNVRKKLDKKKLQFGRSSRLQKNLKDLTKLNDYVVATLDLSNEPKWFDEAKGQSDWKIVMNFEMDSLYIKPNVGFDGIVD